jgi:transcriptional activator SPT7
MFSSNNASASHLPRPSSRHGSYGRNIPTITRLRTPNMSDDGAMSFASANVSGEGVDTTSDEDPRAAIFRGRFALTEARLMAALGGSLSSDGRDGTAGDTQPAPDADPAEQARPAITPKKPARAIDEDDYGDDDDEGDDEEDVQPSPLLLKGASNAAAASNLDPPSRKVPSLPTKLGIERTSTPSSDQPKSSDDVRKKLQQDKKAAEDAARRSFHTLFYTLENDRDAMLEQQKLDELDRQVETEMSGQSAAGATNGAGTPAQQGSLSTANLGASSLTLKHLIARIDAQRDKVHATDAQLRSLISEVRKNRSKWANEDRVGQEELYESMEKVLMELKATEHAHPFLQRVNKREAPDYYTVIKHPMDIGTMMKKLKGLSYKSKKEFVDDLMLIWSNCLKYNADPAHFLRKKALYMKKETEKLVPLIPEIVVRDRAEVEAEERRMQRNGDVDADGVEDSDDGKTVIAV